MGGKGSKQKMSVEEAKKILADAAADGDKDAAKIVYGGGGYGGGGALSADEEAKLQAMYGGATGREERPVSQVSNLSGVSNLSALTIDAGGNIVRKKGETDEEFNTRADKVKSVQGMSDFQFNRYQKNSRLSMISMDGAKVEWDRLKDIRKRKSERYSLMGLPEVGGDGLQAKLAAWDHRKSMASSGAISVSSKISGDEDMPPSPPPVALEDGSVSAFVLYDYVTDDENELNLNAGEYILVYDQDESGWWLGLNSDSVGGFFPSNYVEIIDPNAYDEEEPAGEPGADLGHFNDGGDEEGDDIGEGGETESAIDPSDMQSAAGDLDPDEGEVDPSDMQSAAGDLDPSAGDGDAWADEGEGEGEGEGEEDGGELAWDEQPI